MITLILAIVLCSAATVPAAGNVYPYHMIWEAHVSGGWVAMESFDDPPDHTTVVRRLERLAGRRLSPWSRGAISTVAVAPLGSGRFMVLQRGRVGGYALVVIGPGSRRGPAQRLPRSVASDIREYVSRANSLNLSLLVFQSGEVVIVMPQLESEWRIVAPTRGYVLAQGAWRELRKLPDWFVDTTYHGGLASVGGENGNFYYEERTLTSLHSLLGQDRPDISLVLPGDHHDAIGLVPCMDRRLIAVVAASGAAEEHRVLLVYDRHGRKVAQAALPSKAFDGDARMVVVLTRRRFLVVRDDGVVKERSLFSVVHPSRH